MGFVELPDHRGLLHVPDGPPGQGKHACPDCHVCQHCSDDRCTLCRGDGKGRKGASPPATGEAAPADR